MMSQTSNIDYDRLYEALEWESLRQDRDGNDIGHCFDPFGWHKHGDRTGKLIFYKDSERASCFVCGGFTLDRLIAIVRDVDEEDAEHWLSQFREGEVKSDESFLASIREKMNFKYTQKPKGFPKLSNTMLGNFAVYEEWDDLARKWAIKRGISPNTVAELNLRYGNVKRLPPMGIEDDPYQGPAIIIPHYWNTQLVGWQYRWLDDKNLPGWLQKYTNTRDFPKERTIYNFDKARGEDFPVIICESVTTVMWLYECGIPAVATFGAKVTDGQVKILRKLQQGIILSPDNDKASTAWMNKLLPLSQYVPLRVLKKVPNPIGKQGADLGSLAPDKEALFNHLATL